MKGSVKSRPLIDFFLFISLYFPSDTEIHYTETRIETNKYAIDTHIYRFNIKHA